MKNIGPRQALRPVRHRTAGGNREARLLPAPRPRRRQQARPGRL